MAITSYHGGAFHASLPNGKSSGEITLSSSDLTFRAGEAQFHVPFDGIVVKRGGAANRLLFFTNSRIEGLSVYTPETQILTHPIFQSRMNLQRQVESLAGSAWKTGLVVAVILLAVLALIAALYLLKEPMVAAVARRIPVAWEEKLGDAAYEQVTADKRLLTSKELDAQLNQLTAPLVRAVGNTGYTFKFHIVDDGQVNAFAFPGGNVVINRGLLLEAKTPEEVAGVLAHELSHVTLKHGMRQIVGTAGLYVVLEALLGDVSGLLAAIANNGAFLLTRQFSRAYERQADEQGWRYLLDAKIDPRGMIDFFKTVQRLEAERSGSATGELLKESLQIFSTHPGTEERIAELEKQYGNLPASLDFVRFPLDFERFQADIRSFAPQPATAAEGVAPK